MFFICRLIDEVVIFIFFVTDVQPFKERDVPVLSRLALCEGSVFVTDLEYGPRQSFLFPLLETQL